MLHVCLLVSLMCVGLPGKLIRLRKGLNLLMYRSSLFFCLALQGRLFTIGTELMKSVEEEVNFDGHFYTFNGFNVSIFSPDSLHGSTFEARLAVPNELLLLCLSFCFSAAFSGQFSLHLTQRLELWLICASSTCLKKQP